MQNHSLCNSVLKIYPGDKFSIAWSSLVPWVNNTQVGSSEFCDLIGWCLASKQTRPISLLGTDQWKIQNQKEAGSHDLPNNNHDCKSKLLSKPFTPLLPGPFIWNSERGWMPGHMTSPTLVAKWRYHFPPYQFKKEAELLFYGLGEAAKTCFVCFKLCNQR